MSRSHRSKYCNYSPRHRPWLLLRSFCCPLVGDARFPWCRCQRRPVVMASERALVCAHSRPAEISGSSRMVWNWHVRRQSWRRCARARVRETVGRMLVRWPVRVRHDMVQPRSSTTTEWREKHVHFEHRLLLHSRTSQETSHTRNVNHRHDYSHFKSLPHGQTRI